MKKLKLFMLLVLLWLPQQIASAESVQNYVQPTLNKLGYTPTNFPLSSVVVNAENGDVLFSDQIDKQVDPASITKLMTAYLIYEAVAQNKLSWEQKIVATQNDQAISQLPELSNSTIVAGQSYTLKELMLMHLMASSNVASVMMANVLSENNLTAFVQLMNDKANVLQMSHTVYTNPSGAITSDFNGLIQIDGYPTNQPSYSSASDIAKLSIALIKDYPAILEITSLTQTTVGQSTSSPEILNSTNATLPGMSLGLIGVDGLKTGTSETSGYSYVATVKRNGVRLVVVVLGVGNYLDTTATIDKFYIGNALIEQTYATYQKQTLLNEGIYQVDDTEIQVTQPYELYTAPLQAELTYRLENEELVIQRPLTSLYGNTEDRISIINVTKIKQEEARKKQEELTRWIILTLAIVILAAVIAYVVFFKSSKKSRRTNRYRRR